MIIDGVNLLCAHERAGQTQHLFSWRRISQSEIRNSAAESKGGQKFLPPENLTCLEWSGWGELNSRLTYPKRVYCHYTTPR